MKEKRYKAGFTIEAAVVVPLLMVLCVAVLLVAFALHDRAVLRAITLCELTEQAGREESLSEENAAQIQALIRQQMIAAKEVTVAVNAVSEGYEADAKGSLSPPGGLIRTVTGDAFWQMQISVPLSELDGRKALIRYKTLCDGLEVMGTGSEQEQEGGSDEH